MGKRTAVEFAVEKLEKLKETHKELIICPECQHQCNATVIHSVPFFTYIHHCEACNYVITESDWQEVKSEIKNL